MSESEEECKCLNVAETKVVTESDLQNAYSHYHQGVLSGEIEDYFLQLSDKKVKNRKEALETIKSFLIRYQQVEAFEKYKETLTTDLIGFIRKEKPLDCCILSCQVLSLIQVCIDFDNDSRVFSLSRDTLINTIKNAKSAKLQTEALYSLGLMHFLCECDDEETEEFISLLTSIIHSHKENSITAGAILNWSLLMSISPTRAFLSDDLPKIVSSMIECLAINDMDLRIAAGKGLAFIHESLLEHPSYDQSSFPSIPEAIEGCLSEYNRYWKESKDPEKRSALRQIRTACSEDGHPDISATFKLVCHVTMEMEFTKWSYVIMYELCQRCLGEGFVFHIILNELLSSVFEECIVSKSNYYDEQRKVKKVISEQKRDAIRDARRSHERKMKAYEDMCMDDPF